MRVIAGTAKGRTIDVPAGDAVRPTGDRVREALFSSLMPILRDAVVLDLFAGSGALGIEALSRGARSATFVESDRGTAALVRKNLQKVELAAAAEVIEGRALAFLRRGGAPQFTLAFLDPPYALDQDKLTEVLVALFDHLTVGATVVVERDRRAQPPEWPAGLEVTGDRAYGSTRLHRAVRVADSDEEL